MNHISTIFFDLDDTLLDHSGAEAQAVLTLKDTHFPSVGIEKFRKIWSDNTKKNWQLYQEKKLTFPEQRRQGIIDVWQALGKTDTMSADTADTIFREYLSLYENFWRVFPDVLSVLDALDHHKISLGIITNGNAEQQMKKLSHVGLLSLLQPQLIVISEAVKFSKPHPEIFQFAQQLTPAQPKNLLFVGDDFKVDIQPAMEQQWQALHLNRNHTTTGENVIHSLTEILSRLKLNPPR